METKLLAVDKKSPSAEVLQSAVELLRKGEVVAFPTETVYGLGANALDSKAVSKIFEAKNRPSDNPLIVHIASQELLKSLVDVESVEKDPRYSLLMKRFWPGPLTILFPKKPNILSEYVTSGLDTVAIRMPSHPVAFKLIELSGLPLAAPSANRSGRPSPTEAKHVFADLNGRIPLIVDGGPCGFGVESTVVDLARSPPMILRPGGVTHEELKEIIPDIQIYGKKTSQQSSSSPSSFDTPSSAPSSSVVESSNRLSQEEMEMMQRPPTPGLKYTHYSPDVKVILFDGQSPVKVMEKISSFINQSTITMRIGVVHCFGGQMEYGKDIKSNKNVIIYSLGCNNHTPSTQNINSAADREREEKFERCSGLFRALRELEGQVDVILVEGISEDGEGLAFMNRVRKAASETISC